MPELQTCAAEVLANADGARYPGHQRAVQRRLDHARHYGRPHNGVHALQLEMAQDCYMDEAPPYRWDPDRSSRLSRVLQKLVGASTSFRPPA